MKLVIKSWLFMITKITIFMFPILYGKKYNFLIEHFQKYNLIIYDLPYKDLPAYSRPAVFIDLNPFFMLNVTATEN